MRFAGDDLPQDPKIEVVIGDITDKTTVANITEKIDVVWHLAAVVSSAAEADFDLGMDVNLYGLLNLLEELRKNKQCLESFLRVAALYLVVNYQKL